MAKTSTSFGKGENNKRGKAKRTLIIDALEKRGDKEEDFWKVVVDMAMKGDPQIVKLVSDKLFPGSKATLDTYEITLKDGDTRLLKADAIMAAALAGDIPIDVAERFLNGLADIAKIEEVDSILDRLAILEEAVNK